MKHVLGVSSLALVLVGCVPGVVGSGHVVTESRAVPNWTRLDVQNGMTVMMTVGAPSVTVRADDNLLPYVETYVEADTLVVRHRPNVVLYETATEATLSNETLAAVEVSGGSHATAVATASPSFPVTVSGGSHATVSGVASGAMRLDVSGGSHATLAGTVTDLTLYDSGGSHVAAIDLSAVNADLDVSGGSHLDLTVTSSVHGNASGGSQVVIYGRPATASVSTSGGSKVTYAGQ